MEIKKTKKIVLLGDSIRLGYDKYVKMAFEDVAEVYYPSVNCCFASYLLRYLYDWKLKMGCGDDVDLVHWNAGLWDTLILLDGENHTPIAEYAAYVERICRTIGMLYPNAKMVFATSTTAQEELYVDYKRSNKDVVRYNEVAVEIVKRYGGQIDDLYTLTKEAPKEYHSDRVHFYTKEGTKLLSNQVISCIEEILDVKAKPLDYDTLFAEVNDFIGL